MAVVVVLVGGADYPTPWGSSDFGGVLVLAWAAHQVWQDSSFFLGDTCPILSYLLGLMEWHLFWRGLCLAGLVPMGNTGVGYAVLARYVTVSELALTHFKPSRGKEGKKNGTCQHSVP